MFSTTVSAREFNQDTSKARKAANRGPVFITNRGRPVQVLMSIEAYQKLAKSGPSLLNALAMDGIGDFEFDPPRLDDMGIRPAEFD